MDAYPWLWIVNWSTPSSNFFKSSICILVLKKHIIYNFGCLCFYLIQALGMLDLLPLPLQGLCAHVWFYRSPVPCAVWRMSVHLQGNVVELPTINTHTSGNGSWLINHSNKWFEWILCNYFNLVFTIWISVTFVIFFTRLIFIKSIFLYCIG